MWVFFHQCVINIHKNVILGLNLMKEKHSNQKKTKIIQDSTTKNVSDQTMGTNNRFPTTISDP